MKKPESKAVPATGSPVTKAAPSTKSESAAAVAGIADASGFRILKIASCSSTSGKSTLRYTISCDAKHNLYLRIFENNSSGFFSDEHVSLKDIQQLFVSHDDTPIAPSAAFSLLEGRSQNTPAFLFAALASEGLIERSTSKPRCYLAANAGAFMAEVKRLIDDGTSLKSPEKGDAKSRSKDKFGSKGKAGSSATTGNMAKVSAAAVDAKVIAEAKKAKPSATVAGDASSLAEWAREGAKAEGANTEGAKPDGVMTSSTKKVALKPPAVKPVKAPSAKKR